MYDVIPSFINHCCCYYPARKRKKKSVCTNRMPNMKQDGFLFSAALVVGLLPMGTVSYSTPVYREPTRVQNQAAPLRKSQDFSTIFSGVDRVFEELNKGAYYVGKQWLVCQE
jgi:hypothetical protein